MLAHKAARSTTPSPSSNRHRRPQPLRPMTRGRESNHAYLSVDGEDTPADVFDRYLTNDWIDLPPTNAPKNSGPPPASNPTSGHRPQADRRADSARRPDHQHPTPRHRARVSDRSVSTGRDCHIGPQPLEVSGSTGPFKLRAHTTRAFRWLLLAHRPVSLSENPSQTF